MFAARAAAVRGLAVTSATRSQALPEIPAIGEFLPGPRGGHMERPRRAKKNPYLDFRESQPGELNRENDAALASVPGMSSKTTQGAFSSCRRTSAAAPISLCQGEPPDFADIAECA
jgi:hypothetical protein